MNISKSILSLSILAFALAGCSTYQAPQIPTSQMAHISELNSKEAIILIHAIDGTRTTSGANEYGLGILTQPHKKSSWMRSADETYDIIPGHRILDVLYQKTYDVKHKVSFNAKPGKSYQMAYRNSANGGVTIYVKDLSTGQEVPTSQHY